jgi:predicted DCC family thiol-disulfide oxidoreductase YuxK
MRFRKLKVFVDGWCPMCRKFGRVLVKLDILNIISLQDIRTSEVPSQDFKDKGLKAIASSKSNGKVYFGFDSIFQISLLIPFFWIFIPFLFVLKITKIGAFLYSELAMKRTIIPLHCDKDCDAV